MSRIVEILMKRDGVSKSTATALLEEAKETFYDYCMSGEMDLAENICEEFFGLEPDYLDEFL